jgi:hypothetical protein
MTLKFSYVISAGLLFLVISAGSVALVFAGFTAFRWLAYIFLPIGAIFSIFFAILAIGGKIKNDLKE